MNYFWYIPRNRNLLNCVASCQNAKLCVSYLRGISSSVSFIFMIKRCCYSENIMLACCLWAAAAFWNGNCFTNLRYTCRVGSCWTITNKCTCFGLVLLFCIAKLQRIWTYIFRVWHFSVSAIMQKCHFRHSLSRPTTVESFSFMAKFNTISSLFNYYLF